jgi:hypothetical protein
MAGRDSKPSLRRIWISNQVGNDKANPPEVVEHVKNDVTVEVASEGCDTTEAALPPLKGLVDFCGEMIYLVVRPR